MNGTRDLFPRLIPNKSGGFDIQLDEMCSCGHPRTEHADRFDFGHGHCQARLDCPGVHCACPQFSWIGHVLLKIGDGATVCIGTDRYAATVTKISKGATRIVVQLDKATRTDDNGMSEQQTYDHEPDPDGELLTFNRGKFRWRNSSRVLVLGQRRTYRDPSF